MSNKDTVLDSNLLAIESALNNPESSMHNFDAGQNTIRQGNQYAPNKETHGYKNLNAAQSDVTVSLDLDD